MKTKRLFGFVVFHFFVLRAFSQMQSDEEVIIREKVHHDLYVAGGTVTIDAPVYGDLVVAGGTVTINDTITQDILVAGGNIFINKYVGDDVRCAGGKIKISSAVRGDVVATGGTLDISPGVIIQGDLLSSGGEVTLDGEVNGTIKNASGTFTLNGKANGDIDCRGGKIIVNGTVDGNSTLAAKTIEIGSGAHFNKDVHYWNEDETLDFRNALHGGHARLDSSLEPENGRWHYLGFASLLMVLWYLGTALVMIVLIQYLFSTTFKKAADTVKNTSLRSLGLGFLFLAGVPIIIVVSMITIFAIPIGILILIGYVAVILLGTIIVALLVTHWLNNTFYQSAWSSGRIVLTTFGIFVFLKLGTLTPLVGPLIMLLLACMAFGGILQNVKWKKIKPLLLPKLKRQT